jgi:transposase InsO family protein
MQEAKIKRVFNAAGSPRISQRLQEEEIPVSRHRINNGLRWRRRMPKAVIVHSDRGSQYRSTTYQKLFHQHQLICSMSKKGNCYDNAAMKSWNP